MPKKNKKSKLFLEKEEYNRCIEGLVAQGIDRKEAVETLSIGLKQANGVPVKENLPASEAVNDLE